MVSKAAILTETPIAGSPFVNGIEVKEYIAPEPKEDEAVIKVQAAALNHR